MSSSKYRESSPSAVRNLAEKAQADDVATSTLVDSLLGIQSSKFSAPLWCYQSLVSVGNHELVEFLQEFVHDDNDMADEVDYLTDLARLELEEAASGELTKAVDGSMMDFLQPFLPQCRWEIAPTWRYNAETAEGMVVARKMIEIGEDVEILDGEMHQLTQEQEFNMALDERCFSIIVWDGQSHTLSGTVRFVNHACNANTRFVRLVNGRVGVRSTRNIHVGEEITVYYGPGFFGPGNRDCGCAQCTGVDQDGQEDAYNNEHGLKCLKVEPELRKQCASC